MVVLAELCVPCEEVPVPSSVGSEVLRGWELGAHGFPLQEFVLWLCPGGIWDRLLTIPSLGKRQPRSL